MAELPETILQFGGGRFLRGFADLFVDQANRAGHQIGRIVVAQTTDSERARLLNTQAGRYHVLIRGLENGERREQVEKVESLSRALIAQSEWPELLELARSSALQTVLSNTTEAGLALDETDTPDALPPRSFPAKLLVLLKARFDSGLPGLDILPCELIEHNGEILRTLVLEQAQKWNWTDGTTDGLITWLEGDCVWRNTLVDRIVTNAPADHPLAAQDKLLIAAEPFALWAVQHLPGQPVPFGAQEKSDSPSPQSKIAHPALVLTPDVQPYALRKVRILNGAHTALVCKTQGTRFQTVREAMEDNGIRAWLETLLFTEIVPTLEGRVEQPEPFARQVLERFANPFLEHKLADIALYHEKKIAIRLLPTHNEYRERFGKPPAILEGLGSRE